MFLRSTNRRKDGKEHRYFSIVENRRLPGGKTVQRTVLAALNPMLADPNFALTFQASRVEASKGGDITYSQGAYTMTVSDPKDKKKTLTDKGKYLTVWQKQVDGGWKAVADMINSDQALVPPATKRPAKQGSKGRRRASAH